MPVTKFGQTVTNNSSTTRVISNGLTPSQANTLFIRRDGGNDATADINMNSHKLINVSNPTNNQDVATKNYVDSRDALKVNKSGDTITGDLLITSAVQTSSTNRKIGCNNIQEGTTFTVLLGNDNNKLYYDHVNSQNPVVMQTIGGLIVRVFNEDAMQISTPDILVHKNVNMSSNRISSLPDPVSAQDAATKNYVDSSLSANGHNTTITLKGQTFLGKQIYRSYFQGNSPNRTSEVSLISSASNLIRYEGQIKRSDIGQMQDLHLIGVSGTPPGPHVSPIYFSGIFNTVGGRIQFYNNGGSIYSDQTYWVMIEYTTA